MNRYCLSFSTLSPVLDDHYCPLCRVDLYSHHCISTLPDTLIPPTDHRENCNICGRNIFRWFENEDSEFIQSMWLKLIRYLAAPVKRRSDCQWFESLDAYLKSPVFPKQKIE